MATTQTEESIWLDTPPTQKSDLEMPQWYQDFQKASWEKFQSLPVASRKDEDWRYADLKKSRFERLYPVQSSTQQGTVPETCVEKRFEKAIAHFVFVNGELVDSDVSNMPEGVICGPINEAIAHSGDRLAAYFDIDATRLGDEKFAALNGAATNYGLFILAPKGLEIDGSISVQHYISGDSAPVFPRTLVVAEDNAKVSLIETFESLNAEDPSLSIGVCDLHADGGGKIEHVLVQNLNIHSKLVYLNTSNAGKDSRVRTVVLNLGGAWIRNESINRMTGNGADTQIFGANLSNDLQEFDQRSLQIHDAQHTTSDLLIKNALYDKSRVIFGGLIQVLPKAHHTDSYQSCRNLLGSEEAEINAMPGLEIDADQVRCSHGATSGQISDEEIFYLRTRGIPADEARRIVSCGFLNEAMNKIDDKDIVEWLSAKIERKFDRIS